MKLQIRNFQSIEKADLDFSGFTVITGKSNLGKSAVRRALATLLYNDWSPNYIREGKGETKLVLFSSDNKIEVHKGKNNTFIVNDKSYSKIGNDVPDEYKDFGWTTLETQDKEYKLNIATQLEPLFMVGYTDVENTRIINSALQVDIFEEAARLANKDTSEKNTELKHYKSDLKEIETSLEVENKNLEQIKNSYEKIVDIAQNIREINHYIQLKNDVLDYTTTVTRAKHSMHTIEAIQQCQEIDNYLEKLKLLQKIKNLKIFLTNLTSIFKQLKNLSVYFDVYLDFEFVYSNVTYLTKQYSNINVQDITTYLQLHNKASKLKKQLNEQNNIIQHLTDIRQLTSYINEQKQLNNIIQTTDNYRHQISDINEQLQTIDVCPLCNGKGHLHQ